jgi:hypothetical protein
MNDKPAAESKTVWINALNVVAALVVYWQAPESFTPEVATTWLTGTGVGNLILRKLSKAGIKFS